MINLNIRRHNLGRRKRVYAKPEICLYPDKWKNLLDRVMYPVGLIGPLMMIPQIIKIYVEKDASSIAISSWSLFLIPALLWVTYGFSHKNKVIITCNSFWVISYSFVVIGAILY